MFYSPNETLIHSLISSAVTRLTLKPSRLHALSSNTAHCARQPAAYRRAGGGRRRWGGCVCECLWKCVAESAVVQYPYRRACFCVFACVGVRDRCRLLCQGWGRTLPPQPRCLQRLVSTQRVIGWTPFSPPHTPTPTGAHTPSPLDVISLYANSRPQDNLAKWGGSRAHSWTHVFSDAYRWKRCAFAAGLSGMSNANRGDSYWQRCLRGDIFRRCVSAAQICTCRHFD